MGLITGGDYRLFPSFPYFCFFNSKILNLLANLLIFILEQQFNVKLVKA